MMWWPASTSCAPRLFFRLAEGEVYSVVPTEANPNPPWKPMSGFDVRGFKAATRGVISAQNRISPALTRLNASASSSTYVPEPSSR